VLKALDATGKKLEISLMLSQGVKHQLLVFLNSQRPGKLYARFYGAWIFTCDYDPKTCIILNVKISVFFRNLMLMSAVLPSQKDHLSSLNIS
jgi:hypothetical protein